MQASLKKLNTLVKKKLYWDKIKTRKTFKKQEAEQNQAKFLENTEITNFNKAEEK